MFNTGILIVLTLPEAFIRRLQALEIKDHSHRVPRRELQPLREVIIT
jgi:hypothetical protein